MWFICECLFVVIGDEDDFVDMNFGWIMLRMFVLILLFILVEFIK